MGQCCCCRHRRDDVFKAQAIVPQHAATALPPKAAFNDGQQNPLLDALGGASATTGGATSSSAPPPLEEEDLGNSDEDEGIDDSSSGSDSGMAPELLWARQSRRQERQKKRRQRALRQQKRATAAASAGQAAGASEDAGGVGGGLDAHYSIEERIGRGTFAAVSKCTHLQTQATRALKSIDKRKTGMGDEMIREEIEIMRMLSHPHCVRLHDVFEDGKMVHLVMELCTGGELYEHLVALGKGKGFDEEIALKIVWQVITAVAYLHSLRVAHRDLKPENFLLSKSEESMATGTLKVIDFGLSKRFQPGEFMKTMACTALYCAPEVADRKYTESCDVWSCGVIVYVVLCGVPPFCGATDAEILAKAKEGLLDFEAEAWAAKSAACQDLIRRMLCLDTSTRLTAEQALDHPWLRSHA
eukprot:TRINITY_DN12252_c0_g2_i1.p2 TRINITY_DN12252_c0_g2~~TRINITY_DN12252_c0_g2_i1.p2  ORF type:complete len:414 (+),score=121.94 TRINITY_DN12252_c0_g2_i1:58-1299(+)